MDRIKKVQEAVGAILRNSLKEAERENGYKHLYGVSQACAILAMKRDENVELAMIAGLLHDIYTYKMQDSQEHAHKGSLLAKDILYSIGSFSNEEISTICQAINNHSDKERLDTRFDEILKDADVLQHCLYHDVAEHERDRFRRLKEELGLI